MIQEEFDVLVERVERRYGGRPRALQLRMALLVVLGYAIFLVWFLPLLLLGGMFLLASATIESGMAAVFLGVGLLMVMTGGIQALGLLWLQMDRRPGVVLRRTQAPELFALLSRLRTAAWSKQFHAVWITAEFNAGVQQIPRLGIFGWPRRILTLGLPLLESLSAAELGAVLAHEFEHLSGKHGRFGAWIYRLRKTWQQVFERLHEPPKSRSERLARRFLARTLDWYWPRFNAHAFVLSRANEYAADGAAAEWSGAETAAASLWRIDCHMRRLRDDFWPALWKLTGVQAEPPADVTARLAAFLAEPPLPAEGARWMEQAARGLTDNVDTHPGFHDRLRAIGKSPEPLLAAGFPAVTQPSAAEVLLGDRMPAIRRDVDLHWQKQVKQAWRSRHARTISLQHRLSTLQNGAEASDTNPERLWEATRAKLDLEGPEVAEPLLRSLLQLQPGHAAANLVLGQSLLGRGIAEGEQFLRRILEEENELIPDACHALSKHFLSLGRADRAQEVRKIMSRYQAATAAAAQERNEVKASDRFVPHELDAVGVASLRAVLDAEPDIGSAYLARKELKHFVRQPLFVLCVRSAAGIWSLQKRDRDMFVAGQLVRRVRLPGRVLVVAPRGAFRALGRAIMRLPDACIYPP